jgi:hypothetical protein
MPPPRKKKDTKTIFGSIRKPTAPPSRKFGDEKPKQKIYPAKRKIKHKQKVSDEET